MNRRDLFTFCRTWLVQHPGVTCVAVGKTPQFYFWTTGKRGRSTQQIAMDPRAWQAWGRQAFIEWWRISRTDVELRNGRDEIVSANLLVYAPNLVWESDNIRVYHKAGRNRLYWIVDGEGVLDWEPISTALEGSYAVVSATALDPLQQIPLRDMITVTRPGSWKMPSPSQDSAEMPSTLAIADCLPGGVLRPAVDDTADWLRRMLPQFKVGVPTAEDVALKLSLEYRWRVQDRVSGSPRPLAFTLQAIDDVTFPWPGLWFVAGTDGDFRTDFTVLLVWDAVLQVVTAANHLHLDVRPGLCYGGSLSASLLRDERRFSKRDLGLTEVAYALFNPDRAVGSAEAVAARLLQAATHELSHLGLRELQPHSEIFTSRREQLFLASTDLLPAIGELVRALGLDKRPKRSMTIAPINLQQWLRETLLDHPVISFDNLVHSWASVRNLTEGRAQRDLAEALEESALDGALQWEAGQSYIYSAEPSPLP